MSAVTKPILLDETFAAKMDALTAALTHTYYTLTVTALTKDDVTVTGQIVTVREGGKTGVVFATEAYNGQPVSFSLPQGFHYYVEISNTLNHHFGPTYAEGIINGTNKSVILYYSDLSHITSARDIQEALNAGEDLTGLVGESITCAKGNSTLAWDVVHYTEDDGVTLLLHDTLPDQMQFDKPQALGWFESGLAVGNYKFKHGNNYYYFALTQAIPVGGQLRATTTMFETYASPTDASSIESGTVSTTEISGANDLGTTGSDTGTYPLNHMDRVNYGSNNMVEGPLNYWLNHDIAAGTPIPSLSKYARAYTFNTPGFLKDLDQDFLDAVADTEWKCATNTTFECPASMGGVCTKGQRYTYTAKFSLASEKEIFGVQQGTSVEAGDFALQYFIGSTADDRKKYYNNTARPWWVRSPRSDAYVERYVSTSGAVLSSHATDTAGVVPACKIRKSEESAPIGA